jgi:signal transduction histidine kinase
LRSDDKTGRARLITAPEDGQLSLRWKINLILIVAFAMLAGMIYVVERRIVLPSFVILEETDAHDDMSRCVDDIKREIEHLCIICGDWAAWDDNYSFCIDHNDAFIKANLTIDSFKNNHLDFLAIVNGNQEQVWAGIADTNKGEVSISESFAREIAAIPGILPKTEAHSFVSGVVTTSMGPMFVCSRPILTSANLGPAHGTLFMGRFFHDREVQALAERTRVNLKVWEIGRDIPPEDAATLRALSKSDLPIIRHDDPKVVQIASTFPSIHGTPALYLRADIPADIMARGNSAVWWAVLSASVAGAAIVLFMWALLNREVLQPLLRVTRHAKTIGSRDDLSVKLNMQRRDEIGALGDEFDRMTDQLARSRAALLDNAHKAGMAEIAAEVLHNVGNALNSVNVATQTMEQRVRSSKVTGLNKAAKMLEEHKTDLPGFLTNDARGTKLIDYVIGLADAFTAEQEEQLSDLATLQSRVHHINDVIAVQQTIATHNELIQNVDLRAMLNDVIAMHQSQLSQNGIEVMQKIDGLPQIATNKSKLMQVLVNLIKNGIESILSASSAARELTVRAYAEGYEQVVIEVADTGAGIDPRDLGKLFMNGFTTKPTGNGIGLHFCANAVRAMGGTIELHSDGVGRGAKATVRLPISKKESVV